MGLCVTNKHNFGHKALLTIHAWNAPAAFLNGDIYIEVCSVCVHVYRFMLVINMYGGVCIFEFICPYNPTSYTMISKRVFHTVHAHFLTAFNSREQCS